MILYGYYYGNHDDMWYGKMNRILDEYSKTEELNYILRDIAINDIYKDLIILKEDDSSYEDEYQEKLYDYKLENLYDIMEYFYLDKNEEIPSYIIKDMLVENKSIRIGDIKGEIIEYLYENIKNNDTIPDSLEDLIDGEVQRIKNIIFERIKKDIGDNTNKIYLFLCNEEEIEEIDDYEPYRSIYNSNKVMFINWIKDNFNL